MSDIRLHLPSLEFEFFEGEKHHVQRSSKYHFKPTEKKQTLQQDFEKIFTDSPRKRGLEEFWLQVLYKHTKPHTL